MTTLYHTASGKRTDTLSRHFYLNNRHLVCSIGEEKGMLTLLKHGVSKMFNQVQIQQLAELIIEAEVDTNNQDDVTEYLYLMLEEIAGCECLTASELEKIQLKVLATLNSL